MTSSCKLGDGYVVVGGGVSNAHLWVYGGDPTDSSNVYNYRMLQILSLSYESNVKNAFRVRDYTVDDGAAHWYLLFGEHNKPIGNYTGTGSATSYTVETGGYGRVMVIMQTGIFTIVTRMGAFGVNTNSKSTTIFTLNECMYKDGTLTIASSDTLINKSNTTYTYQVL